MKYAKTLLVLFLFFVLLGAAEAKTLEEQTFKKMGYSGVIAQGANEEKCAEFAFYKNMELNKEGHFTVLSVHAVFSPISEGKAKVTVYLNGEQVKELTTGEFRNKWARIVLEREKLKETNQLTICAKASESITKVEVLDDSIIGTYLMPYFPEGTLTKKVSNDKPLVGEEVTITVTLRNEGSEAVEVKINRKKPNIEREDIEIIRAETQTEITGTVEAGKEIKLVYTAEIKLSETRVLEAAIATYTNIFGEKETIYSNYPEVIVLEPEKAIEPTIFMEKPLNTVGKEAEIIISAKNNSQNTKYNISLKLTAPEGVNIKGNTSQLIDSLEPKETRYFTVKASAEKAGVYELGCTAAYDANVLEECEKTPLEFEETAPNTILPIGIVLMLIGLGFYAYIYLR